MHYWWVGLLNKRMIHNTRLLLVGCVLPVTCNTALGLYAAHALCHEKCRLISF